jgi:hypothetical protein
MAIDFGRMFRGVATGYIGAKIENTAANDRLKANIMESAGQNFFNNVLPEAVEQENLRRQNYDNLVSSYGGNFANIADASGFTADKASMLRLDELLEKNELNEDKLKNLNFETDYNNRYNTRVKSFEEKYQPILNQIGIKELGGLGFNTMETLVGDKQPGQMKQEDMAKAPTPSADFSSMQLKDYLTAKPDEATESSQYRLRLNDIQKQAVTSAGLNAKFISNPDGSTTVTDIDEASQNKFQLVTEISSNIFSKEPNRSDYLNIGNEAATRVMALESLAKNGNTAINNYFQSHIQKAPKVDGKVDYTSEEKVYPLNDGTMVNAREVFERQNADLIRAYIMGSVTQKNFIREKFDKSGRGYSVFFDQIDDALDQQENS